MPLFNNVLAGAAGSGGADAGYKIERSLRFSEDDDSYLTRTPSTAGNRQTWTLSFWMKRGKFGTTNRHIFETVSSPEHTGLYTVSNSDALEFRGYSGGFNWRLTTQAVLRDPAAWYHICVNFNSTAATASDRAAIYINGVKADLATATYPSQNHSSNWNNNVQHFLGSFHATASHWDGYLAEVHSIDGQALAPDGVFGEFDADTGVWNPIEYTGSHGPALDQTATWSGMTSTSGNYVQYSDKDASHLFNGSLTDGWQFSGTTASAIFTPTTGISYSSEVRVYILVTGNIANTRWKVNGGSYQSFSSSGTQWLTVLSGSGTFSSFELYQNGDPYTMAMGAIEVDGVRLVDSGITLPHNGFHLDFSDNSSNAALGTDSSGNSNTWTVNNISTVEGNGNWISQIVTTGGNRDASSSYGVPQMFDNSATTECLNGSGTSTTWTPTGGLAFSSSFKMHAYDQDGGSITFNWSGGSYSWTLGTSGNSAALVELSSYLTSPLTSITWSTPNNQGPYIREVEVDGKRLIDNSFTNTDSFIDSPTNYESSSGNPGGNYATWNVLDKGSTLTLANGNLQIVSVLNDMVRSTIAMTSGKWYAEYTHGTSLGMIGIANADANNTLYLGQSAGGVGYYTAGTTYFSNNGGVSYGASYTTGDVIGVAFDADTGSLTFYKNGVSQGAVSYTGMSSGPYFFACGVDGMANSHTNFGQRPFAYTPPTGFKSLCTQNLDDPLIADGSTAFDVVTYSGSGYSNTTNPSQSITGLSFSPDLVWSKARNASYSHGLFDSVRGPNKQLRSNGTAGETDDSGISSSLVSFDSNGFTLGPDAGAGSINYGGTSYVAWAWDGGELATNSAYNQSEVWTNTLTSSNGFHSNYPAANAFDGSVTDNQVEPASSGGVLTFTPSTAISYTTSVEFMLAGGNKNYSVNGGATQTSNSTGDTWTTAATGSGTLTSLAFWKPSDWPSLRGIRVDGKLLVDAGVIPVGSLNSSAYDQSQTWSSGTFFNANGNGFHNSNPITKLFDGVAASVSADGVLAASGGDFTLSFGTTFSSASTVTFDLEGGGNALKINGSFVTLPGGSRTTVTYNVSGLTSIQWYHGAGSTYCFLLSIKVDGKELVDSGVSVTNVPSIASTVRVNQTAGISIIKYDGSGSAGTIAHNLNAQPHMVIVKNRGTSGYNWKVLHKDLSGFGTYMLSLDSDVAEHAASAAWFNSTAPTNSVISLGRLGAVNASNEDYLCLAFAPVEGYSAFGKYTGNGSNTDGPCVHLGFRPRFFMVKNIGSGWNWNMFDSKRSPSNVVNDAIRANLIDAEVVDYNTANLVFTSNGVKVNSSWNNLNQSGGTFVYMAFAENPFKYARAR